MRKILSLVLVLSMVLGSFGFAFAAPADVEGTDFEDAVTRLSALDVLSGFPDGTFRPDETVTRAQFAKIMANALGVGSAAQYAHGATKFADVPADYWAAGYINVVSDMKIVNGYGDGNFGPEDQVTYAEAITMIVRALGYEPKAKAIGGYPGGYIAIGAEEEITDDVNVINTLAANRGDVALMVDASLTVPMMYQKTWGQYPEYANDDEDKTLMKTKLGVDEITGVVEGVPNVDSTLDEGQIAIDGKDYDILVEDFNYDSILGLEVTVWADGSDVLDFDIETDEDDIFFDTVVSSTDKDGIEIYVEDDTFKWADDAKVYVNFEEEKDFDAIAADSYGYIVLNEDEEVAYANLFKFGEVEVGAVYDVEDDVYSYVDPDKNEEELELSDFEDGVFIYNDKFQLVDEDEIAVNSAIFAWETSDELYLVVKNETVEGTLERVKATEVKIDDTSYDASELGAVYSDDAFENFAKYTVVGDLDNLGDEAVVAVLDLSGNLLLIYGDVETTSSTMYGIVTYAEVGSKAEASIFTKDGEVDYVFETRNDATDIEQGDTTPDVDYFTETGALKFPVMQFKLNADGEIDSDYLADTTDSIKNVQGTTTMLTKDADKKYVAIDGTRYYISEDTVFMTAFDSDGNIDPAVVEYEDVYESDIASTLVAFYGEAGKDADMIVFLDPAFTGADDDVYYGIVTDAPWKDGSDYVAKIDVFDKGEDEYVVANENAFDEGTLVAFRYNTDDEIEITSNKVTFDDDAGTLDCDTYLELPNDTDRKTASGAIAYAMDVTLNNDGTLKSIDAIDEEIKLSDIEDYNNIEYVLDDDQMFVVARVYTTGTITSGGSTEDSGIVTYINTDETAFAVDDSDPYTIDENTVLRDKDGKIMVIGQADIFPGTDLLEEGDKVEVTAAGTITGGVATEIKIVQTKEELAEEAEQAVVDAELAKVADAYEIAYSDKGDEAGATLAAAAVSLVEADVDTAEVSVGVAYADSKYTVTLTSKEASPLDTVTAEKVVEVTIAEASTDASIEGVKVKGVDATLESGEYNVTLPTGTTYAAGDIVVTATDSNATVAAATGGTDDTTSTWTVKVTAEDGSSNVTYTINVTVAP